MKKNLRIVSAAAAALLAVAPVAASAVSVNADAVNNASTADGTLNSTGDTTGFPVVLKDNETINVTPTISLNTSTNWSSASLSAAFKVTVDGTSYNANLNDSSRVKVWTADNKGIKLNNGTVVGKSSNDPITDLNVVNNGEAGRQYKVEIDNAGLNLGTQNANKTVKLVLPKDAHFYGTENSDNKFVNGRTATIKLDKNGAITTLPAVIFTTTAKDFANPAIVNWKDAQTGAVVNSGDVTVYAGSDAGKMNISEVLAEVNRKYYAENTARPQSTSVRNGTEGKLATKYETSNIKDALKSLGVDVSNDGWFVAPKTFNFKVTATAPNNDASSTLNVTVNVPNGHDVKSTATDSSYKDATIMATSEKYNAQGTAKHSVYGLYNHVNLVTNADGNYKQYVIGGKSFYKVANEDTYVKVANVTGSKRTIRVRSRQFKGNGKLASKTLIPAGRTVTVYGGRVTVAGHSMYRIGYGRYVKVANF